MTRTIPVLLYHSVSDDPDPTTARWTVSRAEFAAHVEAVRASGRAALTIGQLAAGLRGERRLPDRAVAITFDDGFADTCDAVRALLELGLASTVYITTSEVGAAGRLSPSTIAELAREPSVEVGAHGVRHVRIDELGRRELDHEVRGSRSQLQEITQIGVHSFAYPHGAYDGRARAAVIEAGYGSAAAVKNALSHVRDDPFAIARWTVTSATPASRIAEVLEGEGVKVARTRERLRTRAHRAVRRTKRLRIMQRAIN